MVSLFDKIAGLFQSEDFKGIRRTFYLSSLPLLLSMNLGEPTFGWKMPFNIEIHPNILFIIMFSYFLFCVNFVSFTIRLLADQNERKMMESSFIIIEDKRYRTSKEIGSYLDIAINNFYTAYVNEYRENHDFWTPEWQSSIKALVSLPKEKFNSQILNPQHGKGISLSSARYYMENIKFIACTQEAYLYRLDRFHQLNYLIVPCLYFIGVSIIFMLRIFGSG